MHKQNFTLIVILLLTINTFSQDKQWEWKYPVPQGNSLKSVCFTDTLIGWAVGDYGIILNSVDGGTNWNRQDCPISANINSIYFIDKNTGWTVGQDSAKTGIVLKTLDRGLNWFTFLKSDLSYSSIYFNNDSVGYLLGLDTANNTILYKTENGGDYWSPIFIAEFNLPLSIQFVNDEIGYICGNRMYWISHEGPAYEGIIYKTLDGGQNWNAVLQSSEIVSMNFINPAEGFVAMSYGSIYTTADSGKTWTSFLYDNVQSLSSAYFLDENNGWAYGQSQYFKTTDGGKNWLPFEQGSSIVVNSIIFINDKVGWAVGNSGLMAKSIDGGNTWIENPKGIKGSLQAIHFSDKNNGWAAGGDYYKSYSSIILHTTDGGANWLRSDFKSNIWIQSIQFISKLVGIISGYDQTNNRATFKTIDGGSTWIKMPINLSYSPSSIFCVNDKFYAGINGGSLLTTIDGGINWQRKVYRSTSYYNAVYFTDINNGWVVGNKGEIYKLINNQSLDQQSITTSNDLYSVFFIDKNIGWIVGERGTVLKTMNSGETWEFHNIDINEPFRSVYFIDYNNGCLVGDYGNIYTTNDGGINWVRIPKVTYNNLTTVYFSDSNNVWIGGEAGTILHLNKGDITSVEILESNSLSNNYNLSQNYPNPFNPTTKIRYSLPKSGNIRIYLYDILGREIMKLVDEHKENGSYEINIRAENLSNGIYYYRILSGNYSETKKMVLLK